jgi:hypothetical protein
LPHAQQLLRFSPKEDCWWVIIAHSPPSLSFLYRKTGLGAITLFGQKEFKPPIRQRL